LRTRFNEGLRLFGRTWRAPIVGPAVRGAHHAPAATLLDSSAVAPGPVRSAGSTNRRSWPGASAAGVDQHDRGKQDRGKQDRGKQDRGKHDRGKQDRASRTGASRTGRAGLGEQDWGEQDWASSRPGSRQELKVRLNGKYPLKSPADSPEEAWCPLAPDQFHQPQPLAQLVIGNIAAALPWRPDRRVRVRGDAHGPAPPQGGRLGQCRGGPGGRIIATTRLSAAVSHLVRRKSIPTAAGRSGALRALAISSWPFRCSPCWRSLSSTYWWAPAGRRRARDRCPAEPGQCLRRARVAYGRPFGVGDHVRIRPAPWAGSSKPGSSR